MYIEFLAFANRMCFSGHNKNNLLQFVQSKYNMLARFHFQ